MLERFAHQQSHSHRIRTLPHGPGTPHCAGVVRQPVVMETVCCLQPARSLNPPEHGQERAELKRLQAMARSDRDVIDFSALERELQGAIESEQRYKRENEAKLRAVSQGVSSYGQFRDLVLSCHLKPLEKKDRDGAPRKQPWNPVAPSNK